VRAYIQHGLSRVPGTERLYYIGPMFRRERPQKGRQREFHQIGAEAIGSDDPYVDAETIEMVMAFLGEVAALRAGGPGDEAGAPSPGAASAAGSLAPGGLTLIINSVGCAACRPQYREALRRWLESPPTGDAKGRARIDDLCGDCKRRLEENPLRVFDCKI